MGGASASWIRKTKSRTRIASDIAASTLGALSAAWFIAPMGIDALRPTGLNVPALIGAISGSIFALALARLIVP